MSSLFTSEEEEDSEEESGMDWDELEEEARKGGCGCEQRWEIWLLVSSTIL